MGLATSISAVLARHLESAAALADGVAMGSHGAVRCTPFQKKTSTAPTKSSFSYVLQVLAIAFQAIVTLRIRHPENLSDADKAP